MLKKSILLAIHLFTFQTAFATDLQDQYCRSKSSKNPYAVELYSHGAKAYLESVKGPRTVLLAEFFCQDYEGQMKDGSKIVKECFQKGENVIRHLMFTQKHGRLKVIVFSTESESDLIPLMTLSCRNAH